MSPYRIILLFIACFHQVCSRDESVTVFRGQSAVLKTGAESWNLTKAEWYIYKNTTYIASLKDGKVILHDFWRYQGRLKLNKTTGDLTINNVTMDDGMIYNVDLVHSDHTWTQAKVNLTVQERLEKPVIQKTMHSLQSGQCHVALNCSAFGQKVSLSWTPDGDFNGSYISGIPNSTGGLSVLYLSFSGNINVTFNCTASCCQQTETEQMTVGCSDASKKCEVNSCASSVMWTVFIAVVLAAAYACFMWKEEIKDFCTRGPLNCIQSLWSNLFIL